MKTDIEIARETKLDNISAIADKAGIPANEILSYGHYMAKVPLDCINLDRAA